MSGNAKLVGTQPVCVGESSIFSTECEAIAGLRNGSRERVDPACHNPDRVQPAGRLFGPSVRNATDPLTSLRQGAAAVGALSTGLGDKMKSMVFAALSKHTESPLLPARVHGMILRFAVRILAWGILSTALVPSGATFAQAGAGTIVASAAANDVVDNLRNSIVHILDKLDDSIGSATFLARMQLQVLLSEINFQAKDIVGKTFSELNASQREFFTRASITVQEIGALGDQTAENVDGILSKTSLVVGMIPFANMEPRLSSHAPRVLSTVTGETFGVQIAGLWLAHGKPSMSLHNSACAVVDHKDTSATFRCPSKLIQPSNYPTNLDGKIALVEPEGWFQWLTNWATGSTRRKEYEISIAVVPPVFGDVSVVVDKETITEKSANRSIPFDTGARHCISGPSTTVNVGTAGPEWRIVPGSIQVQVKSSNGSGAHQLNNISEKGFQLRAWASNSGKCCPLGACKDARGWHSGAISWTEVSEVPAIGPVKVFEQSMKWGDKAVAEFPSGTKGYRVKVRLFDGRVWEINKITKNEFVEIDTSFDGRTLSIAPRNISQAFR